MAITKMHIQSLVEKTHMRLHRCARAHRVLPTAVALRFGLPFLIPPKAFPIISLRQFYNPYMAAATLLSVGSFANCLFI